MNQDVFVVVEHLHKEVTDISYVMLAAARQLVGGTGGKVVAVLLGCSAKELANTLSADHVLYADHPLLEDFNEDAYRSVLIDLIKDRSPRAVLFGHTTIGMDIAGLLSIGLSLPLISSCLLLSNDGKFTSQICGGKIMVEGELPASTALITMVPGGHKVEDGKTGQPPEITTLSSPAFQDLRISIKQHIEPEAGDVDISKAPFLIAVGRGIQNKDNIELANELAEASGGTVCASRPVVDQGWLPTARLVGKSGKHVKPKIYLALGISGAPEHVEGMDESDTIIAVNVDSNAPIFNIAEYGTTVDLLDLVPVLTEKVKQVLVR